MGDAILQMFLEDTREHLADIENDLMDIEESGEHFDLELVNKVFRTAHSIKGSASFLNLFKIRDLAHIIENTLDMIRGREMKPSPDVISTILNAFDRLGELVDNISDSEKMDISDQKNRLLNLISRNLPVAEKSSVSTIRELRLPDGRTAFTISEHDFRQVQKGGNYLYILEYDLIHDVHKKGQHPLELIKFLERSGRFLDCNMDLKSIGSLADPPSNRIPFNILFASILEPDLAPNLFRIESKYIHVVNDHSAQRKDSIFKGIHLKGPREADMTEVENLEAQWRSSVKTCGNDSTPPVEAVEGFGLRVDGRRCVLVLTGDVTIERAAQLKSALLKAMARFSKIEIDLTGLERADLSLLQIICAAHRSAPGLGVEIDLHGAPSSAFIQTARRAGLLSTDPQRCGLARCLYTVQQ